MEQTLLTKKELATRWGISISTLDRRIKEGIIRPVRGYKVPRFNIDDVLDAEGTDNSKMSPFERRRLERQIKQLEEEKVAWLEEKEDIKNKLMELMAGVIPVVQKW